MDHVQLRKKLEDEEEEIFSTLSYALDNIDDMVYFDDDEENLYSMYYAQCPDAESFYWAMFTYGENIKAAYPVYYMLDAREFFYDEHIRERRLAP